MRFLLISVAAIALAVPAWATSTTTPTTTTTPSGPSTTTTTTPPAPPLGPSSTTTTTPARTTTTSPSTITTTTTVTPLDLGVLKKTDDKKLAVGNNLTVDDIDDMNVVDAAGNKIGAVDDVLVDNTGKVVAVTVEMGGFLGIGQKEFVLDITKLTPKDKALVTTMTKEQLQTQPEWKK